MKSANIHEVLRSFPAFESAYTALKEAVRDRYNWAIDGLAYMPDGVELYDADALIAVPINDDFVLVATENGDDYGYKIVAAAADEEEE